MGEKEANLLKNESRHELRESYEKAGERSWTFRVLSAKVFVSDLAKNFLSELIVVKLLGEDGERFRHWVGEVFEVLQTLHDGDLCSEAVPMVVDGKTDDFVDTESSFV